eukprot:scaffold86394_cov30-Phaeocystis_antarctica.AAC.1
MCHQQQLGGPSGRERMPTKRRCQSSCLISSVCVPSEAAESDRRAHRPDPSAKVWEHDRLAENV